MLKLKNYHKKFILTKMNKIQKEIITFVKNFNNRIFIGQKGLKSLKEILNEYQKELKKLEMKYGKI